MLKKAQKDKEISEDEEKSGLKLIQDKTDSYIKAIDDLLAAKEADILKV